jgi:hypothetical protein
VMSDYSNRDELIERFGTEEQKKELKERQERLREWVSQFPVVTLEDIMKRNLEVFYANIQHEK